MCTLFVFRATINFFTHTSLLRANAEFCETLLRTFKKYALKYCCSSTLSRTKCFLKWCNIDVLYFYPLRVFCDILCCLEVADDITAERYRIERKMFLSIVQSRWCMYVFRFHCTVSTVCMSTRVRETTAYWIFLYLLEIQSEWPKYDISFLRINIVYLSCYSNLIWHLSIFHWKYIIEISKQIKKQQQGKFNIERLFFEADVELPFFILVWEILVL